MSAYSKETYLLPIHPLAFSWKFVLLFLFVNVVTDLFREPLQNFKVSYENLTIKKKSRGNHSLRHHYMSLLLYWFSLLRQLQMRPRTVSISQQIVTQEKGRKGGKMLLAFCIRKILKKNTFLFLLYKNDPVEYQNSLHYVMCRKYRVSWAISVCVIVKPSRFISNKLLFLILFILNK